MEQINKIKQGLSHFLCWTIRAYQYWLSPVLMPSCRFYPSCSAYAYEAASTLNPAQALFFIIKRLLKCHPWHPGGYDPLIHPNQEKN